MSRVFAGSANEGSVSSVSSSAQVSAFSFSCWVNVADYQSGSTIFVKDPLNDYQTYLQLEPLGTLYGACGINYLGSINSATIVVPGSGYASLDTGFVLGGDPDTPADEAEYRIGGAPGGIPTNPVGFLGGGTGYAIGSTYTTTPGGGQPGVGSGLTLLVTGVINDINATSNSVESIPLDTWTHVAMTWDSAGDGLVHLYINGVECTYQNQRTATINPDTGTGPYVLGDDFSVTTLEGDLAEVAAFGVALTGAQVASITASTTGLPSAIRSLAQDYWHLCGLTEPEPNVVNPTNTGTVLNAIQGPNSPGYAACSGVVIVATKETVAVGEFGGTTLSQSFYNPSQYDLIQVLNEGGEVVWNLDYLGNANVDPASPTKKALVGSYYGASFAIAFPNPLQQDIFQIIGPGDVVHFWVDYQGNAHSA